MTMSPTYKVLESGKGRVVLEGTVHQPMPSKVVFIKGKTAQTLWRTEEALEDEKRIATFSGDE